MRSFMASSFESPIPCFPLERTKCNLQVFPMNTHHPGITIDEALRLVIGAERRAILRHLVTAGDSPVDVEELAAAIEAEVGVSDRNRTLLSLYHSHLPRLDTAGLVSYDVDGHVVRYRPNEAIEALLAFVTEEFESPIDSG